MNKFKLLIKYFITFILSIIVIFILILLCSKYIFKNKVPNVFGFSILRVVSGSMEPNIKVGDYIIIKSSKSYKENDIVTFIDKNNNIITHRIKEINNDRVITKGDANNTVDDEIHVSSIKGKVIYQFQDIFKSKYIIFSILVGLFIFGGLITIFIPSRKK